jgi:acyl-homoserine-lactone acylase
MLGAATVCVGGDGASSQTGRSVAYHAKLVRTRYGVAHITASDWGSLGFGHGYVAAEDNLCVLADAFVTFRGERSRHFGPQAKFSHMGTIVIGPNIDSDFFFRHVETDTVIERFRGAQPQELQALVVGYAAGYSQYVREIREGGHAGRHVDCRGSDWLAEITDADIYRRMLTLGLTNSSLRFPGPIANAQPPAMSAAASTSAASSPAAASGPVAAGLRTPVADTTGSPPPLAHIQVPRPLAHAQAQPLDEGFGSNMIGFGGAATGTHQGLLFGNPHWYWDSADRFQQVHLKIPGQIDVEGGATLGVPIVLIGFNNDVAWSHTVSTAARFTLYRLKLANGDPTSYMYDGHIRHMTSHRVTVDVRNEDGSVSQVTRTLYSSHFGPMLATSWTTSEAFTMRDVNAENLREFRNWFRWGRARNLEDFVRIQREEVAIPWVNTIAVGRNDSRVWYADIGAIPNISDAKASACALGKVPDLLNRMAFDGSRAECEWDNDPASPQPGTFAAAKLPQFLREDYAANMNDSFWLTNARAPLVGYPEIVGSVGIEQSLRTRLGHLLVKEHLPGESGAGNKFITSESVREFTLNSRSVSAELFLDDVLEKICPLGSIALKAEPHAKVDIGEACAVLAKWDRHGNLDSAGALVWDRFWDIAQHAPVTARYQVPFDPKAPLDTPRGLNTSDEQIVQAFATAVQEVRSSPVALGAPRSAYQYLTDASGARIPLAGGCGPLGYFTVACVRLSKDGTSMQPHGNSYMQVVGFTPKGVEPYTLLVPSQSTDPASPHYRDYTRAYSRKEWLRAPFTDREVKAGAVETLDLRASGSSGR